MATGGGASGSEKWRAEDWRRMNLEKGWKIVFRCDNSGWKKSGKMNFGKVGRLFFAVTTAGGGRVGR